MAWVGPVYQPIQTTFIDETWPEKEHHHHIPFPSLRHKISRIFHDSDLETHIPVTDVRETPTEYYIDIELPGLSDKSKVKIKWTSTRSLLVTATIERPHFEDCPCAKPESNESNQTCNCRGTVYPPRIAPIASETATTEQPKAEQEPAEGETVEKTTSNNTSSTSPESLPRTSSSSAPALAPHLTLSERAIGSFLRNFSFPSSVEYDHLHAKLDHGLLRIRVPKKPYQEHKGDEKEVVVL